MLQTLKLQNFRSYMELVMEFSSNLVVIVGPNAVGKTNLLESIFVLSTTKSFRGPDSEMIQYTKPFYKLQGEYTDGHVDIHYTTLSSKGHGVQKIAKLNNKRTSLSSVVGINPVVLFEPADMQLLSGPPAARRRYIDTVLSQTDPLYLNHLRNYKKIIVQRNSLLLQAKRQGKTGIADHLFVYDVQLVEPTNYITQARANFLDALSAPIKQNYQLLAASNSKEPNINYHPSINGNIDILKQYSDSRSTDQASAHTLVGPHRDDFDATLYNDSQPITTSRGETRSLLLAIKLAELDYIKRQINKEPILLLDDVFSELDKDRRKHLMEAINRHQTFITTTEPPDSNLEEFQLIDLSGAK